MICFVKPSMTLQTLLKILSHLFWKTRHWELFAHTQYYIGHEDKSWGHHRQSQVITGDGSQFWHSLDSRFQFSLNSTVNPSSSSLFSCVSFCSWSGDSRLMKPFFHHEESDSHYLFDIDKPSSVQWCEINCECREIICSHQLSFPTPLRWDSYVDHSIVSMRTQQDNFGTAIPTMMMLLLSTKAPEPPNFINNITHDDDDLNITKVLTNFNLTHENNTTPPASTNKPYNGGYFACTMMPGNVQGRVFFIDQESKLLFQDQYLMYPIGYFRTFSEAEAHTRTSIFPPSHTFIPNYVLMHIPDTTHHAVPPMGGYHHYPMIHTPLYAMPPPFNHFVPYIPTYPTFTYPATHEVAHMPTFPIPSLDIITSTNKPYFVPLTSIYIKEDNTLKLPTCPEDP